MIALALLLFAAEPEPQTGDEIMARVAANQNRAEEMRSAFVYHQNVLIRIKRTNGKLAREEYSEFIVTPTAKRTHKERTLFRGKYVDGGKEVEFDKPGFEHKSMDIDAGVAEGLGESFTSDGKSRDGIERDLFPLTSKQQRYYNFRLEGTEEYLGHPVYRITFTPKKTPHIVDADEQEGNWKGEVLVHRDEYQPVLVTTTLATKIPLLVKTMLGTDVQQLGFKVTYKKFDENLWFPVSYGGEFKLKALFLYGRTIGVSMQNSGFQRAQVDSRVSYVAVP
jgi:hypothetical protein